MLNLNLFSQEQECPCSRQKGYVSSPRVRVRAGKRCGAASAVTAFTENVVPIQGPSRQRGGRWAPTLERLAGRANQPWSSVRAVGLYHIQQCSAVLLGGECDIPSIGGECRAAKGSRSLTTPQLRGGFLRKLPDALARAGGRNHTEDSWGKP
jgi:hypothetical protein